MENTVFLENKFLADSTSSDLLDGINNVNSSCEKKKEDGNQKSDETFDFTSDIIDLLLCVENDEHARQNIEAIMDQWDEMNILNEEGSRISINSDINNSFLKSKIVQNIESDKVIINPMTSGIIVNSVTEKNSVSKNENFQPSFSDTQNDATSVALAEQKLQNTPNRLHNTSNETVILTSTSYMNQKPPFSDDNLTERIKALFCVVCGKSYEQIMSTGIIKKMPSKPYPCPFCRGNYFQKSSASIHMKVHMEEEQLKCRVCVAENHLQMQSNNDNDVAEEKRLKIDSFVCSICSSAFTSLMDLERHATIHKNAILKLDRKNLHHRNHSCNCQRKSRYSYSRQRSCRKCVRHRNTSYSTCQYVCTVCGVKFVDKSNYDLHCRLHNTVNVKTSDYISKTNFNTLDHCYGKPVNDLIVEPSVVDENDNVKISKKTITISNKNFVDDDAMDVDEIIKADQKKNSSPGYSPLDAFQNVFRSTKSFFSKELSNTDTLNSTYTSTSNSSNDSFLNASLTRDPQLENNMTHIVKVGNDISKNYGRFNFDNSSSFLEKPSNLSNSVVLRNASTCTEEFHAPSNQPGAFVASDIDDVFQKFYNSRNDEKMLSDVNFGFPVEFSSCSELAASSSFENGSLLNVAADKSKNHFSNLNSDNFDTHSKNILQDQFSCSGPIESLNLQDNSMISIQSSSNIAQNHSDYPQSIFKNVSEFKTDAHIKVSSTASCTNEVVLTNGTSKSEIPSKTYLVVYVLPSNSTTNSNSMVTKLNQQKTVFRSSPNMTKLAGLPSTNYKMTYLVPIIDNQIKFVSPQKPFTDQNIVDKKSESAEDSVLIPKNAIHIPKPVDNEPGNFLKKLDVIENFISTSTEQSSLQNQTLKAVSENSSRRNILKIAYDDACKLIEKSIHKNENSKVVENSQIIMKKLTESSSSETVHGDYTILKRMLSSKPRLSTIEKPENSETKYSISLTEGQGTFQYSKRMSAETGLGAEKADKCVCEICKECFSAGDYLSHLKTHRKTIYKCTYCQNIFVEQSNLLLHMRTHLQSQVFNCKLCKKSFTSLILYRLHLLVHEGLLFICVSCIKLFNKRDDYENHLKTHNKNVLTCSSCQKSFPNAVSDTDIIQHFTCLECISSSTEIGNATRAESATSVVDNPIDTEKPTVRETFYVTENKTSNQLQFEDICFECPYCDQMCEGGVSFKLHKENHLKCDIKCVICEEKFDKFSQLKIHLNTHTFSKCFKCEFCFDVFYDKLSYQNHTHENFKPFPCTICKEFFINKNELISHSVSHSGIFEINCNYCNAKITPDICLSHKLTHSNEEIIECLNCSENFISESAFLDHVKVHHQKSCSICAEVFENDVSLLTHLKIHEINTLSKSYLNKCVHCDTKFNKFNDLLSHTIKFHPDQEMKCLKCSCCSQFFTNECQWVAHGTDSEKNKVLIPYILKKFGDQSFKLEPDSKNLFNCHLCKKSFRNKIDIIKHVKIH